jgi:hypothetical protein
VRQRGGGGVMFLIIKYGVDHHHCCEGNSPNDVGCFVETIINWGHTRQFHTDHPRTIVTTGIHLDGDSKDD